MFAIALQPTPPVAADYIPDWFKDSYVKLPDDAKLSHDFAYHMIGEMQNPKKFETVRAHLVAKWEFLRLLSEEHPDVFDEVLTAFGERFYEIA
jgi:hypothetical protein